MLEINGNTIKLTRGDSAILNIDIFTQDGDIYNLKNGDKLYFIVKKFPKKSPSGSFLIKKEFNNNILQLNNSDTQYLNYGNYRWECCLIFSDGDINTICNGIFILDPELI